MTTQRERLMVWCSLGAGLLAAIGTFVGLLWCFHEAARVSLF